MCNGTSTKWSNLVNQCKQDILNVAKIDYGACRKWFKVLAAEEIHGSGTTAPKRLIFSRRTCVPDRFKNDVNVTVVTFSNDTWNSTSGNQEKGGCSTKLASAISTMEWIEIVLDGTRVKNEKV